jgi:hypothetical protein
MGGQRGPQSCSAAGPLLLNRSTLAARKRSPSRRAHAPSAGRSRRLQKAAAKSWHALAAMSQQLHDERYFMFA